MELWSHNYEKQSKNTSNTHKAPISSNGLCYQQKNIDLQAKYKNLVNIYLLLPLNPNLELNCV